MRQDVARDLTKSSQAFLTLVWPAISHMAGGGRMTPVELVTDKGFSNVLDAMAGIDAWQVIDHSSVLRGIASRVQFSDKSWETFTIRYARQNGATTEYEKRLRAIKHHDMGFLYPHLTVQAYVSTDLEKLVAAAVVRTADLFEHAERIVQDVSRGVAVHATRGGIRANRSDATTFIWIPWRTLEQAGAHIAVLPTHA